MFRFGSLADLRSRMLDVRFTPIIDEIKVLQNALG
jgi:hypothetical protein